MSLIDGSIVWRLDRFYFFIDDGYIEITTYATIGADRPDLFVCYYRF